MNISEIVNNAVESSNENKKDLIIENQKHLQNFKDNKHEEEYQHHVNGNYSKTADGYYGNGSMIFDLSDYIK